MRYSRREYLQYSRRFWQPVYNPTPVDRFSLLEQSAARRTRKTNYIDPLIDYIERILSNMKRKKQRGSYPIEISNQPIISVIIPTLNEIEYLPGLLHALSTQTHKPGEIIIADAGSRDGTIEYALFQGHRVVKGGLPAAGRNAGARAARGDLLFFLDSDVIPAPHFIEHCLKEFERTKYDVATCYIDPITKRSSDRIISECTNLYLRVVSPVSPHASGFCLISRRNIHEKLGGFDESLYLSEDIDYARRASRFGKFGYLSEVRIPVSLRRVEKEGLVGIGLKYAWCELHALAGQRITSAPFEYEFGAFPSKRKSIQTDYQEQRNSKASP